MLPCRAPDLPSARLSSVALFLGSLAPACESVHSAPAPAFAWRDVAGDVADPALAALCRDAWELRMREDPVGATYLGDPRTSGKLPDNSLAGSEKHASEIRDFLRRAESIHTADLSDRDRVTLQLLDDAWKTDLAEHDSGIDVASWSLDARSGPQVDFLTLAPDQPIATATERALLVERWERMPLSIERSGASLRRGLAEGRVASRKAIEQVITEIDGILSTPPEKSPLVAPAAGGGTWVEPVGNDPDLAVLASRTGARALDLRAVNEFMPARVRGSGSLLLVPSRGDPLAPPERARFLKSVYAVVRDRIYPAFRRYRDLIATEVLARARDDDHPGLCALPGGDAYYRLCIRRETSLDLTPEEVHPYGLSEVARIRAEIEKLGAKVLGASDMAGIQEKLRGSPEMHFAAAAEVKAKAEATLARATAAVPSAFGLRPRAGCEVVPIPDHEAPFTTIAYYRQPSADGSRPGRYYVNTFAPATRTRYEAEVLAFHESVPGHHLQIAIAQEIRGLPLVRRHGGSTAFVEGWALYTERLCDELGLYSSDLDRLGMLSFDAWRACRLVVDTGIHAMGWSRKQAIDYMTANTLLAVNNVENEVDRYIGTPGQALAYKIGQREILSLRAKAKESLGRRFDLKEFHDRVLENGAVTLAVLREQIERWIARASTTATRAAAGP
jgi:uncharacterized protein (DUF885 family)